MATPPKGLLPTMQADTAPETTPTPEPANAEAGRVNKDKIAFMYNRAMELAYERGFDQLMAMFKNTTPKTFPRAMAQAVVSMLDIAEQEAGEQANDDELLAVGLLLVSQVYADLIEAGMIEENDNLLYTSMSRTIVEWIDRHRDRATPEMLQKMAASAPQVGRNMQQLNGGQVGGMQ